MIVAAGCSRPTASPSRLSGDSDRTAAEPDPSHQRHPGPIGQVHVARRVEHHEVGTASGHILELPDVDLAYDVHGPLPAADGRPPLFMVAQPMDASGFAALAPLFPDRTVVTYIRAVSAAAPARTAGSRTSPRCKHPTCTP